ncbi:MAG: hypothetical protein HHJ11_01935 [Phycicoccus sp.]|nr:hypothetical protein [Phycicoccus sp.]NMM32987.1 hypothetical protein [Phycicoccus sp.]
MTMRRLSLIFVLVAALAGCSSGTSDVASSTKSTSPTVASPTSAPAPATVAPTIAPTPAKNSAGGGATSFCDAFKKLQSADATSSPAAIAAAFQAAAADMRKYAPPEIKAAAGTYADLIESVTKSAQGNTLDSAALQKALTAGTGDATTDIMKVVLWVGQNCQL